MAKYLISGLGCDVNEKNNHGETGFMKACSGGHLHVIKYLISLGSPMYEVTNEGWGGFYAASYCGHLKILKYLISLGYDVNKKINKNKPFFVGACRSESNLKMVKYLVSVRCDINVKDVEEQTGLLTASYWSNYEIVKYLISLGCDVNEKDGNGDTPFLYTCFHGNIELGKYLISQGCNINVENNIGKNAFNEWFPSGHGKKIEFQILLLEYGIKFDKKISKDFWEYRDLCQGIEDRKKEILIRKETIKKIWSDVDLFIIDTISQFTYGLENLNRTIFID
jgi:ankyrin repeat protein